MYITHCIVEKGLISIIHGNEKQYIFRVFHSFRQ